MGKSGTGKSTLIRGLIGKEVERTMTQDFDVPSVTSSELNVGGDSIGVTFWTSPGISDSILHNQAQLQRMKKRLEAADLVIHTLRMDDTRLRPDDSEIIKRLSEGFGDTLWRKAVVVLTFANRVYYLDDRQRMARSKEHFLKRSAQWEGHVHELLRSGGISEATLRGVPIVPAGYVTETRLFEGDEPWMGYLVRQSVSRMQEEAKSAILKKLIIKNY